MNRSLRLTAGTLALALPLVAAAGCGVEKKKTIKQELSSAQTHLTDSKAASFTLSFDDTKGSLVKLMTSDGAPDAVAQALVKGSVTFVADPAGAATFASLSPKTTSTDAKAALNQVNVAFLVKDDKATLAELRLVAGDLYAHVDLAEIGALAKAGGVDDFDKTLDDEFGSQDPRFAQVLADVRAGKWLKLPLSKYLSKLQDLAKSVAPGLTTTPDTSTKVDLSGLGNKAFAALKPYVKVTDANDSSKDRVLDVKVQARGALKALLGVVKAEKDLPFAGMLGDLEDSAIDDNVREGTANGTITLHDGHLTGFTVDLESIRLLSTDPSTDSLAGVSVKLGIDDSADEVTAPTAVATTDLGSILDDFLNSMSGDTYGG